MQHLSAGYTLRFLVISQHSMKAARPLPVLLSEFASPGVSASAAGSRMAMMVRSTVLILI